MLALLSLAAAATCPCRQPQDIVIVFDAAGTNSPSLDASVNAVLTALVQELSCPDSATQIALVAFAGEALKCDDYSDCTTVLAGGLTSDASTLTAAIAGRGASEGERCTSCGIERALQILKGGRAAAGATVLLLTNGAQTVGGAIEKAGDTAVLLMVAAPLNPTPHPRPDSRRSPDRPPPNWPTGIRASRPWDSRTASHRAATT